MKEIFISEKDMPKSFADLESLFSEIYTNAHHVQYFFSLEQLKQQVRREFAEKLKSVSYHDVHIFNDGAINQYIIQNKDIDNLLKQYEVEE